MSHESPHAGETPRQNEDLEHQTLKAVLSEEEQLLRDIGELLAHAPDKDQALTRIIEEYLPKLDEAGTRFEAALKAWRDKLDRQFADLEKESEQ